MDPSQESVDVQEHLAAGQFARPWFRQPIDLQRQCAGSVFEVDDDEEDWDLFEDITEENYEEDTYALFQSFTPVDTQMRVMEIDGAGSSTARHFDATQQSALSLVDMEKQMENVTDDGSVKKMIIKRGNGTKVPDRCRIYYHYVSIAEGDVQPFDTTLIRKYPPCTDLRQEGILARGFEIAIRSMELREASRFIVVPELLFGTFGCTPRVPGNKRILYIIETLQYIDEQRLSTPLYMSVEERSALPFQRIFDVANTLRTEGNGEYKNENLQFAIRKWRKGVQILEDYPVVDGVLCTQRTQLLHTLYANIAQGYLKLEKPAQACNACKIGLKLVDGEDSCKLLFRFAKAKLMLKDTDAAFGLVEQGLRINSKHTELKRLQKEIKIEDDKQTNAQKKMWKGFFKFKSKSLVAGEASTSAREIQDNLPEPAARSSSTITLMGDDYGRQPSFASYLKDLGEDIDSDDRGIVGHNIRLEDDVPDVAYCSEESVRNSELAASAEASIGVLDALPSIFFDLADLGEKDVVEVTDVDHNGNPTNEENVIEDLENMEATGMFVKKQEIVGKSLAISEPVELPDVHGRKVVGNSCSETKVQKHVSEVRKDAEKAVRIEVKAEVHSVVSVKEEKEEQEELTNVSMKDSKEEEDVINYSEEPSANVLKDKNSNPAAQH